MSALATIAYVVVSIGLCSPPPAPHTVGVEFGQAMSAFVNSARRAQSGLQPQLRVVHFGDSNIAARAWSEAVALHLSPLASPGGPGYLLPKPGRTIRSGGVTVTSGTRWKWRQARFRGSRIDVGDGMLGLMGAALDSAGNKALLDVRIAPGTPMTVDIIALCRPKGGSLMIHSGRDVRQLKTDCVRPGVVRASFALAGDRARLKVKARGGPVRVLGVSAERPGGGLVYDILGVNGHQASAFGRWDASIIGSQLRRRRPDLVVISYGGNEAFNPELSMPAYRALLEYTVARVRLLAPDAACMLTAPIATCPRGRVAAVTPRIEAIIGIQRLVARESGCGFWDTAAVFGGAGALCPWTMARPAMVAADGMHLTRRGYRLLGALLGDALMALVRGPEHAPRRMDTESSPRIHRPLHLQEMP
ncbi:MAG: lysophospholipase L1-like esterase [Myxococcota bacterium]|jgi:lysophospholipase L1-like esterase